MNLRYCGAADSVNSPRKAKTFPPRRRKHSHSHSSLGAMQVRWCGELIPTEPSRPIFSPGSPSSFSCEQADARTLAISTCTLQAGSTQTHPVGDLRQIDSSLSLAILLWPCSLFSSLACYGGSHLSFMARCDRGEGWFLVVWSQ